MIRSLLLLSTMVFLSTGISFADFQDELMSCSFDHDDTQSQGYVKCSDKVREKYLVSKKTACLYQDGLYQSPLEAKRPNKKVLTSHFYKYNNTLYYPVTLDYPTGGGACLDGFQYNFYAYDCKTKKAADLAIKIPMCGVSIVQANKAKMLLLDGIFEGGDITFYRMFDAKSMLISSLNITKFKGFASYKQYIRGELESLFNSTNFKWISSGHPTKIAGGVFAYYWNNSMSKNFPYNSLNGWIEIDNINKNFVGNVSYRFPLSNGGDNSTTIGKQNVEIDLLNKKITLLKNNATNISSSNSLMSQFGQFSDEEVGISFSYPKDRKSISKSSETNNSKYMIMLSNAGNTFLVFHNGDIPLARGAYWGDSAQFINNIDDIKKFCDDKKNCSVLTNKNKITYVKYHQEYTEMGSEASKIRIMYYIFNPYSRFRGIVMSNDRLPSESFSTFDTIINSISFYKPGE